MMSDNDDGLNDICQPEVDDYDGTGAASIAATTTADNTTATSQQQQQPTLIDPETEVFDRIANKLLRSGLHLTALELYAELAERGKELPRLREFFDNPHNFERHIESVTQVQRPDSQPQQQQQQHLHIPRSPSEQTFDSLDFTHYSDDDEGRTPGDERIAVLEFQLRKAQQTIASLRASLTMSMSNEIMADDSNDGVQSIASQFNTNTISESVISGNQATVTPITGTGSITDVDQYTLRDYYNRGSADGDSCPGEDPGGGGGSSGLSSSRATTLLQASTEHITSLFEPNTEPLAPVTTATTSSTSGVNSKYSLAVSIKPHERRAINYLLNEYLLEIGCKLTSITFCDENADQDFDHWEDVGLNTERPPDLLRLYRHFWQSSLQRTVSQSSNITTTLHQ